MTEKVTALKGHFSGPASGFLAIQQGEVDVLLLFELSLILGADR
jgi:hypothetical protein